MPDGYKALPFVCSGIGKTTAVMKILGLIPQVIAHKSYHGQPFFCKQINFLNVECPHDGSVKGLCLSIRLGIQGDTALLGGKPQ